jgi:hypothetical protein
MKRQEEALRDMVETFVVLATAGSTDRDTWDALVERAERLLDATATPEMGVLTEWLIDTRNFYIEAETIDAGCNAFDWTLDHIATEHGYGGEDADEGMD